MEEWMRIGKALHVAADSTTWWLGDWLVYGQDRYPERYRKAIEDTSLDYQTLRNYAWIARKVPPDRRRPGLSMQHHAEVAALSPAEQDRWLDLSEKHAWSRNELRRHIRHSVSPDAGASTAELRLTIPQARRQIWQRAAERANCDLGEWALRVLDAAARNNAAPPDPRRAVEAGL